MPRPGLCRVFDVPAAIHRLFEPRRRGIVLGSAWHSGRVINQLFTFSSTIERLRQGPLSEHLDAYAAAVAEQGYTHHSIRQQIVAIADFSRWLKQKHIEIEALDSNVVDRFLRFAADNSVFAEAIRKRWIECCPCFARKAS